MYHGRRGFSLRRKILTTFLIPIILLHISIPATAIEPEYIAVLELHQHGSRPDNTRKMTDRFREELSRYSHLQVLSRAESKAILDYKQSAIFEAAQVGQINKDVSEAKKAYFELALSRADELSEAAIQRCLTSAPLNRDYRSLIEAYTVNGIVALARHRKREASEIFRKLVYYNPQVQLDQRYFAPSVISRVKRIRNELKKQALGSIEVSAKPAAADVYINDVFKGTSPLTIQGYPEGEHVVSVKAANYTSKSQVVQVQANQTAHVKLSLGWKGKAHRFPKDMVGFHKDQFNSVQELMSAAAAAAQAMRVRKLILVDLKRTKGKDVVSAHVIDEHLETFHRPQSVTAKNIKKESAQASAKLATLVLDEMNQTIMDDPKGLAAAPYYGDVVLIGRSQSLLKNPWFWVGMGALAAGGATAGVLVGTGTNTVGGIDVLFR